MNHVGELTGKDSVFMTNGSTTNDATKTAKQIVNANIDKIVITGNNGGFYGGSSAFNNNGGIQEVNGSIGSITTNNPITTTTSTSYGNAAIYTVSASTGNPDLDASSQVIKATIGSIGDADHRFGGGIVSQQGAYQYVAHVDKIYAQQYGIATVLSDIGKQTIEYVGAIDVYSNSDSVSATGIYNSCDTGNYDHVGKQLIQVGESIKADGIANSVAIRNTAGHQEIVSLNDKGVSLWGNKYSILVDGTGVYNTTHVVDSRTTMKGSFIIDSGNIEVRKTQKEKNFCTIEFMANGDNNKAVLGDDVSVVIQEGSNENKDNTRLILGNIENPDDIGYTIVMGKNSTIDDQGSFMGNGTISYNINDNKKTVLGGGTLLKNVAKVSDTLNTRLNIHVGSATINSDSFATTQDAHSVMKDAANHIFVENGKDNVGIIDKVDAEGHKIVGTVTLEEGELHKYTADYFFDTAENVGTNTELNSHNYTYQGDILDVKDSESSTMTEIDSSAMINYFAWRNEIETISQRLGEIRDMKKVDGDWIRISDSENEYGKNGEYFKNSYRSIAMGYDRRVKDKKWIVGGMFSYTDGQSQLAYGGSGDNWVGTLGFYGTHVTDNGEYIDLIGKVSRMHNSFSTISESGTFENAGSNSNWAYAFSAEYGRRYVDDNGYFIDPQVQLTYGRIEGADYTTDTGLRIEQDSLNSLVGRIGVAIGRKIPNGSYFVRFDALKEFDGEWNSVFSKEGSSSNIGTVDMGDTWYELSVGGTCNFSDDRMGYVQLKRSFEADLKTRYRVDVGLRFLFN